MAFTLEQPPKNQILAHLLKQGLSSEPVGHWTQGLSRMANALLAGVEARDERDMESRQNSQLATLLMPQGASPPPPPSAGPSPVAAALSAPSRPPQNVPGPVPQNDPTMEVSPRQVAQANQPQGVAPAVAGITSGPRPPTAAYQPTPSPAPPAPMGPMQGQPPATSSVAPNDIQARVQQLLNSPDRADQALGRRMAQQILATRMQPPKFEKLDEATLYDQGTGRTLAVGGDRRPLTDPEERKRFGIPPDDNRPYQVGPNNRLINPPPETRVNMSTVADPILSGVGEQIVKAREAARDVPVRIQAIHEARSALDKGATTGALADWRLQAQKLFGLAPEDVQNTEVFRASVGREVLGQIKALGANPSNTDRDYIEKVAGGQITLDEKSLRRILDMQEKYARQTLRTFNREAKSVMDANPNAYRSIQGVMQFEEPPEYAAPQMPTTAPRAPAQGGGWQTLPNGVRIRPKQ